MAQRASTGVLGASPAPWTSAHEVEDAIVGVDGWHAISPDKGCKFSPRCLDCPLSRCWHDQGYYEARAEFRQLGLPPVAVAKNERPGRPQKLTSSEQARICALIGAGEGISSVARQFGISRTLVHNTLKRAQMAQKEIA